MEFIYRVHAIGRMFQRDISEEIVEMAIKNGEIIEEYLDDKPFPSFLVLDFEDNDKNKPIHVVYAINGDDRIIITAYRPDETKWSKDFKTRI